MNNPVPQPRLAGRQGRLVRFGSVAGAPPDALGRRMRDVARNLRDRLDAIAGDRDLTVTERRRAAEAAMADAKRNAERLATEAKEQLDRISTLEYELRQRAQRVEASQSPLAVARIQRLASRLETLDLDERAAAVNKALDRRDIETLLAASIVDPTDARVRQGIYALTAPQQFAQFAEVAGHGIAASVAAAGLVESLADLGRVAEPWAAENLPSGGDLFETSYAPLDAGTLKAEHLQSVWGWDTPLQHLALGAAERSAAAPLPEAEIAAVTPPQPEPRQGITQ